MTASPKLYLRSYPEPDGMEAHAAVEEDGWDGMLLTDTQNLTWMCSDRCTLAPTS
ncbi:MAG: hypothetical protein ICV31_02235 [Rubrobacter sp.]|nr:hypothetical protein [Rubrobacter sp.]